MCGWTCAFLTFACRVLKTWNPQKWCARASIQINSKTAHSQKKKPMHLFLSQCGCSFPVLWAEFQNPPKNETTSAFPHQKSYVQFCCTCSEPQNVEVMSPTELRRGPRPRRCHVACSAEEASETQACRRNIGHSSKSKAKGLEQELGTEKKFTDFNLVAVDPLQKVNNFLGV